MQSFRYRQSTRFAIALANGGFSHSLLVPASPLKLPCSTIQNNFLLHIIGGTSVLAGRRQTLGFTARQCNEVAGYTLLSLLNLKPSQPWSEAAAPLRGITPIIDSVAEAYGIRYAPNMREKIRGSREVFRRSGDVDGKFLEQPRNEVWFITGFLWRTRRSLNGSKSFTTASDSTARSGFKSPADFET